MSQNMIETNGFKRVFFVLKSLIRKDWARKYRRSILGVLWSVLNPLLTMIVLTAVFSTLFARTFQIENYPLYLILGSIMFSFVQASTTSAMSSIVDAAPLIKKIKIEKLVFPLEKSFFEIINFAISLIAVVFVLLWFRILPGIEVIFLPLLLIYVLIFSAGIGMCLSALTVFFQDIRHLWSVVTTAWMYATPIFYPFEILPPAMQTAMQFNPVYHYITYFRDIVMNNITPSWQENLICLGMALITFVVGLIVFKKLEHKFILYI